MSGKREWGSIVSSLNRFCSGALVVSIGLISVVLLISQQSSQAQTQGSQQKLDQLLQQVEQQTNQGYNDQALATSQQLLKLARQLQDKRAEAKALIYIGLHYYNTGQPQKALEFYNVALPISKQLGDRSVLAENLSHIGGVYIDIGESQNALEFLNAALPISKQASNRSILAKNLFGFGVFYSNTGQQEKALEFFNTALSIGQEIDDRVVIARAFNGIGVVYLGLGQPQIALEFLNNSLRLGKEQGYRPDVAIALTNIGGVYAAIGQQEKALEFYNASLVISKELKDRFVVARTLSSIGSILTDVGQLQKALEFLNQSLILREQIEDTSGIATTLNNIAAVYDSIGQSQKALEFYNTSLALSREIGDKTGEATISSNIGLLYRDIQRPTEAIANLERSVEITLQLRSGLERLNRQQFLTSQQATSIILIDLLIAQEQPERAYQWVNLTTTADLADYSRLINAQVANSQAQQAIDTWNKSNRQLESLRQQLQDKFSPQLSQQINQLQAQLNQQAETISRQFPEVAELFETKPTDISSLLTNIPAGTVTVHPVLLTGASGVSDTIALFIITKNEVTVTQQKIDPKAFDELVTQYRRQLTTVSSKKYRTTSSQLYDILIRPVESQLQAKGVKQLSIIATGKLRYIPFETLIDSKTSKYLIEKYPINNLTRLSTRSLQQNPNRATLLALANPFPNDGRGLQGAEQEVKSITPLLPGSEKFLGADAKLDTFKIQAPRFPILHLATHGCFRPQGCPDLKLPANTILFRDRNLNIADAALLGLKNTELVVLSACQTAVQANSSGEEFAGIAYLFERAGAESVIASLWLARDEETRDLMIVFYQNLSKGMTKGEALRQAKLSLIDKHPLFWSPFILIGNAS